MIKSVGCGGSGAGALPRRSSLWTPPRFSSSYSSFFWLAAAAGTAGAAGIKSHKSPAAETGCTRRPDFEGKAASVGGLVHFGVFIITLRFSRPGTVQDKPAHRGNLRRNTGGTPLSMVPAPLTGSLLAKSKSGADGGAVAERGQEFAAKKQGAAGITTAAPYVAGQWGRGG